jgi:HSP20 family molecular chaperone IbpA
MKMFFAPAIRGDASLAPALPDMGWERFMGDMLRGFGGLGIEEDDQSWTVNLDVPGVAKEHLNVSVSGNKVLVETSGDAKRHYKFAYQLPGQIDAEQAEARLNDGVLKLRLAKAEAKSRRQITIS